MSGSKISEQFLHPLVVGALGFTGAYFLGEGAKIAQVGGITMSLPMFLGLTTAVSSGLGETLKQWILPTFSNNMDYVSLESTLLSPALVGGVDAAATYFLTGTRFMEAFLLGAGSEVVGSYLYDGIIKPYIQ